MERRIFLKAIAAAITGTLFRLPHGGELQHWLLKPHIPPATGFGQWIWTGPNPRRVCYHGFIPPEKWEHFKDGTNIGDHSEWRAAVREIEDLAKLQRQLTKEGWVCAKETSWG